MSAFTDLMESADRLITRDEHNDWEAEREQPEVDALVKKLVGDDAYVAHLASAARQYHDDERISVPEAIERYARAWVRQQKREAAQARIEFRAEIRHHQF